MTLLRGLLVVSLSQASGCEALRTYVYETAGISPARLVPLYFQEKQYVEERELVAKVKGALAASGAHSAAANTAKISFGLVCIASSVSLSSRR